MAGSPGDSAVQNGHAEVRPHLRRSALGEPEYVLPLSGYGAKAWPLR